MSKIEKMPEWYVIDEDGCIDVPDELMPLLNKIVSQIRLHTISEKPESASAIDILANAQMHFDMSTNDELKNETANGTKPVLSAVLIEQLDKWIEDCQTQANVFFERGMTISEESSLAMKVAYMNVKTLVENSR